jgi:hypothetical protein
MTLQCIFHLHLLDTGGRMDLMLRLAFELDGQF